MTSIYHNLKNIFPFTNRSELPLGKEENSALVPAYQKERLQAIFKEVRKLIEEAYVKHPQLVKGLGRFLRQYSTDNQLLAKYKINRECYRKDTVEYTVHMVESLLSRGFLNCKLLFPRKFQEKFNEIHRDIDKLHVPPSLSKTGRQREDHFRQKYIDAIAEAVNGSQKELDINITEWLDLTVFMKNYDMKKPPRNIEPSIREAMLIINNLDQIYQEFTAYFHQHYRVNLIFTEIPHGSRVSILYHANP